MNKSHIYIGNCKIFNMAEDAKLSAELINGEDYYKISNCDTIRPFFMSIVSDSNHWMFISSNGGLSAGRKDCDNALFPYYTDDKITESFETTGSKSIFKIQFSEKTFLWEPFSKKYEGIYHIERNLFKNNYGNKIIFEEINHDLGLTFRYEWNTSNKYGFVKKSTLINNTNNSLKINLLDGIQNIVPYGVTSDLQNSRSNLVDAYKKSELNRDNGMGIYALSAIIVDKAEPSESLKATISWSIGLENSIFLLSSLQLDDFRRGQEIAQENQIKAEKGAYFVCTDINLEPQVEKTWLIIANVNQSISGVTQISELIKHEKKLAKLVQEDVNRGTKSLIKLIGASDGLQVTADPLINTRHSSNTLFNIMRGGIFDDGYNIEKLDFIKYIATANKKVQKKKEEVLQTLPNLFSLSFIKEIATQDDDKNFKRLCFEYMPLKFSRRHGDPSRPWNKFSINTTNEKDGSKILDYEGNWRDIFQNWEALAHSYPEFIESMIHKFLNATTFDGYNPYRVTKGGIDWEIIEPDDPWSYIGYWGDHQIIYLLKFLELIENHYPNQLAAYFNQKIFVYANVPYKIKRYDDILLNPKDTIDFDYDSSEKIDQKRIELGADGALLRDENFFIYKVNLLEKLLATVLAKLSNFIPEGGIWMNTQRPEWNDANNALVGNGVSMVTLYYLRRFLSFFEGLVEEIHEESNEVSKELATFFEKVVETFKSNLPLLKGKISNSQRRTILDALGNAGSEYRLGIYENGFSSDLGTITTKELLIFIEISIKFLDHSIEANKRKDKLYHAYNLMTVKGDSEISISYLPEMLEGQVAVLSSGYISGKDSLELLDALKRSALFREDQYSYILYPNKELLRFFKKNIIPQKNVNLSALLKQLLIDKNTEIIEKDALGNYHFNGDFNNANSLKEALSKLPEEKYQVLIEKDKALILEIFEEVFDHKSFTGRSGTFYGYEGLGSIYWHMVSKLLLAVQEVCIKAINEDEDEVIIGKLLDHYYEINEGIGLHKSPKLYGAFPTDPYSHTPQNKGAQQPGMTGQVKEDIVSRFGELGVFVKNGQIEFGPFLLRKKEFLKEKNTFVYTDIDQETKEIKLAKNSLCFTYCQVPIIYNLDLTNRVEIIFKNKNKLVFEQLTIDKKTTKQIFERSGEVDKIVVFINKEILK